MNILIRILGLVALLMAVPFAQAADKEKAKSAETKGKAGAKIDINTADAQTLQTLPGVGPATAQAIIAARPFSSVNDLERVSGIGAAKLDDLKPLVRASRAGGKGGDEKGKGKGKGGDEKAKGKGDEKKSDRAKEKSKSSALRGKIDVNTADVDTLQELPGVGAATGRAIVAARPFSSVDDLERVPGIGAARLAEMRDQVTVSRRSADRATTGSAKGAARTNEREERELEPTGRITPVTPTTTPPRTSTSTSSAGGRSATTPAHSETPASTATGRKVNLNTASREELEALPEIGPVKAQAIIDARPFHSVEDVMRVKGVKEGTFDAIKEQITVR